MIHPVAAAFCAGLGTWAATALGAALVFLSGSWIKASVMDFVYGSSAGVMLAACFFSLLGPSVELAKQLKWPVWLPTTVGFILGVIVVKLADWFLPETTDSSPLLNSCFGGSSRAQLDLELNESISVETNDSERPRDDAEGIPLNDELSDGRTTPSEIAVDDLQDGVVVHKNLVLLVLVITLHNFPEGIALGFAFGGLKSSGEAYTLSEAIMLAVALAIQNVPEGMAVSVPLHRSGLSKRKAFMLGQFSGSIEVLGAVLGASFALLLTSFLPFCLSFAAGAMIYVVLADLIPHSTQTKSHAGLYGCLAGFVLMMALDTGFS